MFEGKVWRYGDNIDTDVIIPARYLNTFEPKALAAHCMEDIDTTFAGSVQQGDIMVGGKNFGCGSSREQAPAVLKALGVRAVFANSFARIFFRNAINIGLPVIVCEGLIDKVKPGEELSLDMESGTVCVNGQSYRCTKLPPKMQAILDQGGLIAALNREEA